MTISTCNNGNDYDYDDDDDDGDDGDDDDDDDDGVTLYLGNYLSDLKRRFTVVHMCWAVAV